MFYKRHSTYDRSVEDFYLKEAVDLPGKKNSGSKFENMVNKKVLTKTVAALYKDFRKTHPTCNISLTTFSRRRPRNVLLSSSRAFVQCLCEICVNPMLKVEKLKKFLPSSPSNVDELVSETLCKCELLDSKPCIERVCSKCGVKKIVDTWRAELQTSLEDEITWMRWEKTVKSRKDLVKRVGTLNHLIEELAVDMEGLARHVMVARWQRKQYQTLQTSLPEGTAVVTLDFAENYLCKFQNEVQSAHWSYRQVSVHPYALQYRCPKPECSHLVTDYQVFLSDDLCHDSAFAKCVTDHMRSNT